jgi:hypothetical protein
MFFFKLLQTKSDLRKERKKLQQEQLEKDKKIIFLTEGLIHYYEYFQHKDIYCLYPLVEESDFFEFSRLVIQELTNSFLTMNSVLSAANTENYGKTQNKKHAPVVVDFIKTYASYSKQNTPDVPIFIDEENWELITLKTGMDMELFQSSANSCPHAADVGVYGYSQYAHKKLSFESIKESIKNEDFDIAFFQNQNYYEMPIYIDSEKIDLKDVVAKIEFIAGRFGKIIELHL